LRYAGFNGTGEVQKTKGGPLVVSHPLKGGFDERGYPLRLNDYECLQFYKSSSWQKVTYPPPGLRPVSWGSVYEWFC